jgi:hypothetical protein
LHQNRKLPDTIVLNILLHKARLPGYAHVLLP